MGFAGFGAGALRDFAVVPEEGLRLRDAREGDNGAVDGFFWRHAEAGWWFKIPDHCAVVVVRDRTGEGESAFTWTESRDPGGALVQRMRGLPDGAGWVEQRGATGHPVRNPFR